MPGRGSRKKTAKIKKLATQPTSPIEQLDDVADGWTPIVTLLCSYFNLPDLTTRKGLKKIHAEFDTIYSEFNDLYERNITNERIRGGIIAIYAKMCIDALLRNKLFEKGILDKLIPLLDIESTRHLALRALTTITRHGGISARAEIAKHAAVLTRLVDEFPDDPVICAGCIAILSHTLLIFMDDVAEDSPQFSELLISLDLTKILHTAVHCMTRPFANQSCIEHATHLITSVGFYAHDAFKGAPEAVKVMVALMRSLDWTHRCLGLRGLSRIHRPGSDDEVHHFPANTSLSTILRQLPQNVNDAMVAYGPPRCVTFLEMQAKSNFMEALHVSYLQDRNLCSLGLKLYQNILSTEFSISDGVLEKTDPRTGRSTYSTDGDGILPFRRWRDALVACAKALRERGQSGDAHVSNVLEIKHMLMHGDTDRAAAKGRAALVENPQCAYYYYAISVAADSTDGLRAAKQGMKCKDITPFIKFQLMQRAVGHGAELGIAALQVGPEPGDTKWQVGIALLTSALEDAKRFLNEAPPDNRYLKNVAYWYILLTILTAEEISPDLREIQFGLDRLEIADAVSKALRTGPPNTVHRRTQETVRKLYKTSIEKYGHIFQRFDQDPGVPEKASVPLDDDLSVWLGKLQTGDGEEDHTEHEGHDHAVGEECNGMRKVVPPIRKTELYQCSYCGNPSASLRKCSGCAKTRYCDGSCQKKHWADHKRSCKS